MKKSHPVPVIITSRRWWPWRDIWPHDACVFKRNAPSRGLSVTQTRGLGHATEQTPPCSPTFTGLEKASPSTGHVLRAERAAREGEPNSHEWRRASPGLNYLENDLNRRAVPPHGTHRLGLLEREPSFPWLSPLLCLAGGPGWNILQIYNSRG